MESKGTFFILIIVVAVLTLALAALAGYLFLVQGTSGGKAEINQHSEMEGEEVLEFEKAGQFPLYESKQYFNLKEENPDKIAVIQVNIVLEYIKELKFDKKANVEEILKAYSPKIQEKVMKFFMSHTLNEVKNTDVLDKAKEDLCKQINELLNAGKEKKEKIVYEVIFSGWLYQ